MHLYETDWREDKNACLIRATRQTFVDDPQPEPPECFCDPKHVAKIAETEALSVAAPLPQTPANEADADDPLVPQTAPPKADWRPQSQVRTVLSSLADAKTITYLTNNVDRIKYPEYRRAGLPVTTAWMESLVKEINQRVKGTEKFWNDPTGAEAILQVRAAALSDDNRLRTHSQTRRGSPFTRQPKPRILSKEKIKA